MDHTEASDMPNFSALKEGIGLLKQMYEKVDKILKQCETKSKEAETYKKSFDGLLSDYAEALAESKYYSGRLDKMRIEKEKLEHKQSEGPLDIVKIIEEQKFEVDTMYDIFKEYHKAVQKSVKKVMDAIMDSKDPKQVVLVLENN